MLDNLDFQQILVLDIETVPQYSSYEEMPQNFSELWEQKTQYQRRDGESPAEYYPKAGIWAEFGKIICISAGMFTSKNMETGLRVKSFCNDDEKALLTEFCEVLKKQPDSLILCAHNGKEFDFPYLCRRMLINAIEIPSQLKLSGKKPWEINHLDTLDLWKFGDYKHYTSLSLLAAIFNIKTPKDDISGSDVHRVYWVDKDLERIRIYCQKDVITTAQLLMRFKYLPSIPDNLITLVS
ncbi:MAG: 3'-5' exonuclease [Daejeonella sp.]